MISGKMENIKRYKDCIPYWDQLAEFLNKNNLAEMTTGKYPVVNDDVFVLIQEYETKNRNDVFWESHRKYLDIQIVLSGTEQIGYNHIDCLECDQDYNAEKDVTKYKTETEGNFTTLTENMFGIYYPEDGHKPGVFSNAPGKVKKAVIKIREKESPCL